MKSRPEPTSHQPLQLLSVVIPCRNEEGAITSAVEHLYVELAPARHPARNRHGG